MTPALFLAALRIRAEALPARTLAASLPRRARAVLADFDLTPETLPAAALGILFALASGWGWMWVTP